MIDFNREYNKRERKKAIQKTLKKYTTIHCFNNKYQFCFLLLPWALIYIPYDMLKNYIYSKQSWSTEKATKIINNVLPKILEKDEDSFWYYSDWSPSLIINNTPWYYKSWASKYSYNLRDFIKNEYTNEKYTKTLEDDWDGYWVKFTPKEKIYS